MNRRIADLMLTAGASAMLWLSLAGSAAADAPVPELDPGSAASGIALAVGVAILMAERYRRRK